jgi:hypothetical protein
MSYSEQLIILIISSLVFWAMNNVEDYNKKFYSCPDYCGVMHEHYEKRSQNELQINSRPMDNLVSKCYLLEYNEIK